MLTECNICGDPLPAAEHSEYVAVCDNCYETVKEEEWNWGATFRW